MLDQFLEVSYQRTKEAEAQQRHVDLMRKLPREYLFKVASGREKLAYFGDHENWLDQFQGSSLFSQALELERQELQNRMDDQEAEQQMDQQRAEERQSREELCIQKKMLELQLKEEQEAATSPGTAAPAEEAPEEAPAEGAPVGGAEGAEEGKTAAPRSLGDVESETLKKYREAGKQWGAQRGGIKGLKGGALTAGLGGAAVGAALKGKGWGRLGGAALGALGGGVVGAGVGGAKGYIRGGEIGAELGERAGHIRNIKRRMQIGYLLRRAAESDPAVRKELTSIQKAQQANRRQALIQAGRQTTKPLAKTSGIIPGPLRAAHIAPVVLPPLAGATAGAAKGGDVSRGIEGALRGAGGATAGTMAGLPVGAAAGILAGAIPAAALAYRAVKGKGGPVSVAAIPALLATGGTVGAAVGATLGGVKGYQLATEGVEKQKKAMAQDMYVMKAAMRMALAREQMEKDAQLGRAVGWLARGVGRLGQRAGAAMSNLTPAARMATATGEAAPGIVSRMGRGLESGAASLTRKGTSMMEGGGSATQRLMAAEKNIAPSVARAAPAAPAAAAPAAAAPGAIPAVKTAPTIPVGAPAAAATPAAARAGAAGAAPAAAGEIPLGLSDVRHIPGIAMEEGLRQAGRFGGRIIAANPGRAALALGGGALATGYAMG